MTEQLTVGWLKRTTDIASAERNHVVPAWLQRSLSAARAADHRPPGAVGVEQDTKPSSDSSAARG